MRIKRSEVNAALLAYAPDKKALIEKMPWVGKTRKTSSEPRKHPEEDFQIECFDYLKDFPDIMSWSVPNQLAKVKGTSEGAFFYKLQRNRAMGVKKGVVDIHMFFLDVNEEPTFAVFECKAGYGKPDEDQSRFMNAVSKRKGYSSWGTKLHELKNLLGLAGHKDHVDYFLDPLKSL